MQRRGWEQCDFVYIIGDGYVDHPSFGHAIISRVLEDAGYKIGIISQPDWKNPASINALGEPRLGFLVMGGNMDSMVNHYTVSKAHRKADAYTPGGVMGKRPDYAVTVYCNLIRRTYRRKPIIIGGIEASLRRLAHYDYWSDRLKRSILLDSQADLLIYGMGERAVVEIANALNDGMDAQDITYIDGTVYKTREPDTSVPSITLPAFPDMQKIRASTPRAFPSSTATPTPSAPSGSSSRMATMNLSSRTRRRSRFRRRKWIMSTIFRTAARSTHRTKSLAAFRPSRRSNSA